MKQTGGFLLVRAGGRRIGLPLAHVLEIVQLGPVRAVPVVAPAVRGVVAVQGRTLPLVHLGSLLSGEPPSGAAGGTGVITVVEGRRVCLEVEDAEALVQEPALPVPPGEVLPWAVGVARYGEDLVPLLDLPALGSRLVEVP